MDVGTKRSKLMRECLAILFLMALWEPSVSLADAPVSRTLQVATLDYPPFEFKDGKEVKGIATDLIREVFDRMGQPIEIRVFPFPRAIQRMQDGKADVIFTFYYKEEREEFAYYSKETLVEQNLSFFVLEDSSITFDGDLSKMKDYRMGLVRFSYGEILDQAIRDNVFTNIQYVSVLRENISKLLKKRIDVMPSDRWVAHHYYAQFVRENPDLSFPELKELSPPIQTFSAYVGFSKKNQLQDMRDGFDVILAEMKVDGTYQKIIESTTVEWLPDESHATPD